MSLIEKKSLMFKLIIIISILVAVIVISVSVPSRKLLVEDYVDLDNSKGEYSIVYRPSTFEQTFDKYLLKFNLIDFDIDVAIVSSDAQTHTFFIEPFSGKIKFDEGIDTITLRPLGSKASFDFKLFGVRYETTWMYITLGILYGGFSIYAIVILRKPYD